MKHLNIYLPFKIVLGLLLIFFQSQSDASVQITCFSCSGNTGVGGGFNCASPIYSDGPEVTNFGSYLDQYVYSSSDKTYFHLRLVPQGPTPPKLQVQLSKFDSGKEVLVKTKEFKSQYTDPSDAIISGPREAFSISDKISCQLIWDVDHFCRNYPGRCNQ